MRASSNRSWIVFLGFYRASRLLVIAFPLLNAGTCSVASAQTASQFHPGEQVLDFVVSMDIFLSMCEHQMLNETQTGIALTHYLDYRNTIEQINAYTRQAMIRAGFDERQRLWAELDPAHHSLDGLPQDWDEQRRREEITEEHRDDLRWSIVSELTHGIKLAWKRGVVDASAEFDILLRKIGEDCDLSTEHIDAGRRFVFRAMRARPNRPATPYGFDTPPDMLKMIDEALEEGEELHALRLVDLNQPQAHEEDVLDAIARIRLDYEIQLQSYYERSIRQSRTVRPKSAPMSVSSTDPEWDQVEKKFTYSWTRRYRVSESTFEQIAALLRDRSDEALTRAWTLRYYEALAPNLLEKRWPEQLMLQWLQARDDSTPEQLELTLALREEHTQKLAYLIDVTIRRGIAVKKKQVFPVGDTPVQLKYAESLLDIHQLSRRTIRRFFYILLPGQQSALRRLFPGRMHIHDAAQRMLGPHIDSRSVEALDSIEELTQLFLP